jgi:hypothetical protein
MALVVAVARPAAADMVFLSGGDRITGSVVSRGKRRIGVQTPYGLLSIPREKVEKIRKDDGTEEVLNAPPVPPEPPLRVVLEVGGHTFWQAWDRHEPPSDPSLRLVLSLDERPVVWLTDAKLDPEDLRGAVVNSFSFEPNVLKVETPPAVKAEPAEVSTGRIRLPLRLPAEYGGAKRVRASYQVNLGSQRALDWRDLVGAQGSVELKPGQPVTLRLDQERGAMEFAKKRMQGVETFVLRLTPTAGIPSPAAPASIAPPAASPAARPGSAAP